MSIQDEFTAAGHEYARRLDEAKEQERLAALAIEARRANSGTAFALAIEEALDNRQHDDTKEQ